MLELVPRNKCLMWLEANMCCTAAPMCNACCLKCMDLTSIGLKPWGLLTQKRLWNFGVRVGVS